jgi:hypothetical protein
MSAGSLSEAAEALKNVKKKDFLEHKKMLVICIIISTQLSPLSAFPCEQAIQLGKPTILEGN